MFRLRRMVNMELYKLTIHEARDLLRKREISSRDLTKSVLNRIQSIEDNLKEAVYKYMAYYYDYTKDKAHSKAYNYYLKALKDDYDNLQAILKYTGNLKIIKYGQL